MFWSSLIAAVGLALIHLFASQLRFLDVIPRSRWLSVAGGVAVAYALLHLLPELQEYHEALNGIGFAEDHAIYALTLLGVVVFYGLEKLARSERKEQKTSSPKLFWLHIGSYGVYNALLGYLLVREDRGTLPLLLYFIGIGLHFVVNDYGLRQHHQRDYRRYGRWFLSASIFVGWAIGVETKIHEALTAALIAFLTGGILLNVFKEELPEERASRFWTFALGALGYAAILLIE